MKKKNFGANNYGGWLDGGSLLYHHHSAGTTRQPVPSSRSPPRYLPVSHQPVLSNPVVIYLRVDVQAECNIYGCSGSDIPSPINHCSSVSPETFAQQLRNFSVISSVSTYLLMRKLDMMNRNELKFSVLTFMGYLFTQQNICQSNI